MKNATLNETMQRILRISSLTEMRDMNRLCDAVLSEAMAITNCDAGALYLSEDKYLRQALMFIKSKEIVSVNIERGEQIPLVQVDESIAVSYVALSRAPEYISDVYNSERFDFSHTHCDDRLSGYRSQTMLILPLLDCHNEVIAVLQLINALDALGQVVPFSEAYEEELQLVVKVAGIALFNMRYLCDNKTLLQSVVEVLAAAIDERSSFSANHTRQVAELTKGFIEFCNEQYEKGKGNLFFPDDLADQIVMAAWLHDIGKIITPMEIMDKSTRLGNLAPIVELRFEAILAAEHIRFLEGEINEVEFFNLEAEIIAARTLCAKSNSGSPNSVDEIALIRSYGDRSSITPSGVVLYWLEPEEIECLCIRYGTLTASERKIMEEHVEVTQRLLERIRFSREYQNVPIFAAGHHEKLNCKGYPYGIGEEELPIGTRILTIMDIFEALTASDRPYKKPVSLSTAFEILDEMAANGELDAALVALLKEWKEAE